MLTDTDVFGAVYRPADLSVVPVAVFARVGDPAGDSDQSLTLTFSTAQLGTIEGTATLSAISDGGTGYEDRRPGQLDLAPDVVPADITIDNPAAASFEELSGPGSITPGLTLDIGTIVNTLDPVTVSLGSSTTHRSGRPAERQLHHRWQRRLQLCQCRQLQRHRRGPGRRHTDRLVGRQ